MKSTGIIAALIAAAAAAPAQKRDIVWVVETAEVVETVYQTTTVWVDSLPTSTAVASATTPAGGEFYNNPHGRVSSQASVSVAAAPSISSSSSTSTSSSIYVPAPVPTTLATSTSSSVAPVVPTYTPPAVSTPEAVSTTTTTTPAPVPTTSAYVAPAPVTTSTTAAAPAQPTGSSSAPSGTTYTGDMTYYGIGLGSCGYMDFGDGQGPRTPTESDPVVAIAHGMMDAGNGANSNYNPWCGKWISIVGPAGNTAKAMIADTCGGCQGASIDLPEKVFYEVAPTGDGRVHGVNWWFD